ncbi:MAG TPA: flotillin-like protein FloA [Planctomycetaceae bacterium]
MALPAHPLVLPAQNGSQVVTALLIVGAVLLALFGLVFLVLFGRYFKLWLRGFVTRAGIGPHTLVFMSLRKVNPNVIVEGKITAVQAGLPNISTAALEAHYLAGGNVRNVIRALIAAQRARIDLDWDTATAIDLAGRNVLEAVQTSVDPKVIDCPDPRRHGRNTLDGVAKDGIQLKVRARVTVRTNIKQLIGGATEETVIARVGEGIVSAIGSSENHKKVLANPTLIAQTVHNKGLDSQTAYEIVSIDIADIDVGDNVGARLQADRAEADMRIARAKAEERRAMAVALEQEMKAITQQNKAQVVLAEAEVPKAIADAYRHGRLRADESHPGGNGLAAGRR